MSVASITFTLPGRKAALLAEEIPDVCTPMHSLLSELQKDAPPPKSLTILPERVKDLTEAAKLAASAKRLKRTDRMISVLVAAAAIVLLAATVLGFIANPLIGTGLMVLTLSFFLVCHLLAASLARREKRELENCLSMYPLSVLLSPFILSHLLWTRGAASQAAASGYEKEIHAQLPEAAEYWRRHSARLAKRIDAEETRAEQTLRSMQSLPIRSLQGEKDLENYRDLLVRTRIEVEKGRRMAER